MFALRMIREYKQVEDEDVIFEVLNHQNEEVEAFWPLKFVVIYNCVIR
jgi:hypothetical protein